MRQGRIDPMVYIFIGAAAGCLLMFTCYRTVSTTFMPSIAMTGAASAHFGTSVNVTDREGVVIVMITDTVTAADTAAATNRAKKIARWIMLNRKDSTSVRRMNITTYQPTEGSALPKRVHDVTWGPADLESIIQSPADSSGRPSARDLRIDSSQRATAGVVR